MKRLWCAMVLVLAVASAHAADACCAAANTLTDQEKQEGWRLLWDGKSGSGWRSIKSDVFPVAGWEMADGMLTVLPKKAGGGAGDIITKETYSSFMFNVGG